MFNEILQRPKAKAVIACLKSKVSHTNHNFLRLAQGIQEQSPIFLDNGFSWQFVIACHTDFTSLGLKRLATHLSQCLLGQQVGQNSCHHRGSNPGQFRGSSTLYRETTWPTRELNRIINILRYHSSFCLMQIYLFDSFSIVTYKRAIKVQTLKLIPLNTQSSLLAKL